MLGNCLLLLFYRFADGTLCLLVCFLCVCVCVCVSACYLHIFAFTQNKVFAGTKLHTHIKILFNMKEMVTVTMKCSI